MDGGGVPARVGPKHHYIPKFYLKQWAGLDGRLCEFSKPYNVVKPRMTHPDGTGYVRGLYTFEKLPPRLAGFLEEQFLLRADDRAYAALCQLLDGNANLEHDLRSAWSRFIMTLIHRTPEGVDRLLKKVISDYPTHLEEAFRDLPDAVRGTNAAKTLDELRANLTDTDFQELTVRILTRVMDSTFLGNALNQMRLLLIRFDDTHRPLLTSDRPIVMTNGLNRPDSHILMPISPRHIFGAANTEDTINNLTAMAESWGMAQRMNNRMARQARRYVYGVDDVALAFVAPRLGERARWSPFE